MAMTRQKWSINGLAVELDLDRRAVAKMLDDCPHIDEKVVRGRITRLYHLADVVRHLGNGSADEHLDLTRERAALARAQTKVAKLDEQKRELDLRVRRGELLDARDVENQAYTLAAGAKARLIAMVGKLPPQLVGLDQAAAFKLLDEEVRYALTDISTLTDGWTQEDLSALWEFARGIQERVAPRAQAEIHEPAS
jgi:hypothetical protein